MRCGHDEIKKTAGEKSWCLDTQCQLLSNDKAKKLLTGEGVSIS